MYVLKPLLVVTSSLFMLTLYEQFIFSGPFKIQSGSKCSVAVDPVARWEMLDAGRLGTRMICVVDCIMVCRAIELVGMPLSRSSVVADWRYILKGPQFPQSTRQR